MKLSLCRGKYSKIIVPMLLALSLFVSLTVKVKLPSINRAINTIPAEVRVYSMVAPPTPPESEDKTNQTMVPLHGDTKSAPDNTKSAPDNTKSVPDDTNSVPDDTKIAPDNTKSAPDDTKSAPDDTKSVPDDTKNAPDDTKSAPDDAKSAPDDTKNAPDDTKSAPDNTKSAPDDTKSAPDDTKSAPDDTKNAPDDTKNAPNNTKNAPDDTKNAPDDTKNTPDDTKNAPGDTKSATDDTKSAPDNTKSAPDDTKNAPDDTKNAPGDIKSASDNTKSILPTDGTKDTKQDDTQDLCDAPTCAEVLSEDDKKRYNNCMKRCRGSLEQNVCRFIPASDRAPVPLVSFPGSGNTWVRGLLQQATGLCTGAVYCDGSLRCKGFPGEDLRSGSVIAVKTHNSEPVKKDGPPSVKALIIIRNPYDAMVAERNRQIGGSHVRSGGEKAFGSNNAWNAFVLKYSKWWQDLLRWWIVSRGGKLKITPFIIKYEDLKKDTAAEISKVLTYLDMEKSIDDVRACLKDGYNTYKRSKHGNFTHFTQDQVNNVNQIIREAQQLLREKDYDQFSQYLDSYLRL